MKLNIYIYIFNVFEPLSLKFILFDKRSNHLFINEFVYSFNNNKSP